MAFSSRSVETPLRSSSSAIDEPMIPAPMMTTSLNENLVPRSNLPDQAC
jgi:hypothetical protein